MGNDEHPIVKGLAGIEIYRYAWVGLVGWSWTAIRQGCTGRWKQKQTALTEGNPDKLRRPRNCRIQVGDNPVPTHS
jgi:hypothetical protein